MLFSLSYLNFEVLSQFGTLGWVCVRKLFVRTLIFISDSEVFCQILVLLTSLKLSIMEEVSKILFSFILHGLVIMHLAVSFDIKYQ